MNANAAVMVLADVRATGRPSSVGGAPSGAAPWLPAPGAGAEDYLVGIAALAEGTQPVTGARLAKLLGVSEPSVTQMVRRLSKMELAQPRPRDDSPPGIRLTTSGTRAAAWLLTRRRVCECFFVDAIGLDWATAQRAADQMEHGLTLAAVQQLHRGLGAPTTCPHGNRLDLEHLEVPSGAGRRALAGRAAGDSASPLLTTLLDAAAGERIVVERLLGPVEQDANVLGALQKDGITPGKTLLVEGRVPETGAFTVRSGRRRCVLPVRVAALVGVRGGPARQIGMAAPHVPLPCRPEGNVRLTAVRVEGPCESGHRAGDCFVLGSRTPADLCGASYAALLPAVKRLRAGSDDSSAPPEVFERRCPGDGYVVWRLEAAPAR